MLPGDRMSEKSQLHLIKIKSR